MQRRQPGVVGGLAQTRPPRVGLPEGPGRAAPPAGPPPGLVRSVPKAGAAAASAKRAGGNSAAGDGKVSLTVYSKAKDDTIGIETLVGEFSEAGSNHGRKVFKRTKVPAGVEDIPVFMYYWDQRDGDDFKGWWFGESVGGTQVWSKCEAEEMLPPSSGWRIPWDGPVQAGLVVERRVRPVEAKTEKQEEPVDTSPGTESEAQERVQRAVDRVQIAEAEAEQALESTRVMLEGDVTEEHISAVDELLQAQLLVLNEANKVLAADILDARKTAPKAVMRLTKLAPRVRSVQASLAQEIRNAQVLTIKKRKEAEDAKARAADKEQQAAAELRDSKTLEEALPEALEVAAKAEELLDVVIAAASPLMSDAVEDASEFTAAAIKETEAAVIKAQCGLKEARTHINQKTAAAKLFAPEARAVALKEYTNLQDKLDDIQKKLQSYLRIRKEFEQRLAFRTVMAEATRRMGEAELEAEKIIAASGPTASEDALKQAESLVAPAMTTLTAAVSFVEQQLQAAPNFLKQDLLQVSNRGVAGKRKLAAVQQQLRDRLGALQIQIAVREAAGQTKAVEDAVANVEEMELPLVQGADMLSLEETGQALASYKVAVDSADAKIAEAKRCLKAKVVLVKSCPESAQGSITEELAGFMARIASAAQRLSDFKKTHSDREAASKLYEATQKVVDAEAKVQRTIEVALPLLDDQTELEVERTKVVAELTFEAEKVAALACAEGRRVLAAKLKDGSAEDSSKCAIELAKLQARLTVAEQELSRQRKVALQGERLWKAKLVVQEQAYALKLTEDEVEQAEILTTPLGDENPSAEKVQEMVGAVDSVQSKVTAIMSALAAVQSTVQGSSKLQLDGLLERVRVAQTRVEEMQDTTKEQRERMACEVFLGQVQDKVGSVDAAFGRASEAEAPYLKGLEHLPLEVALQSVEDSKMAMAQVEAAIAEAQFALKSASALVGALSDVVSRHGLKEIENMGKKLQAFVERLTLFSKETAERERAVHQQQTLAKVVEAEQAALSMSNTAKEFTMKVNEQGEVEITLELAKDMCERFAVANKQAEDRLEDARRYLMERQRATRSEKKDAAAIQETAKLVSRLHAVQQELQKAKAMASEHEQQFAAKMVTQEASELLNKLSVDLERVVEEATPLLVEGGRRFVVQSMIKMVTEALAEHASLQNSSVDAVFQLLEGAKAGKVSVDAMVDFLERTPIRLTRTDLTFSVDQRKAMSLQMDTDGDGFISESEFLSCFRDRFICVHPISMTDVYDIGTSKSIDKLDVDDVVETLSEPLTHETSGMTRMEVRRVQDGATGWVTMQGQQGKLYFQLYTGYSKFVKGLDMRLSAATVDSSKAHEYIKFKSTELARCEKGPLADAKAELARMKPEAGKLQARLDALKKRIDEARSAHNKREAVERKKSEDKKDRKAAAIVLKAIRDKVEAAQSGLQSLQDIAAPLTAEDISSVEDPIAVCGATVQAAAEMEKPIAAAMSCLTVHEGKVAKAGKGPWLDAKKDMQRLNKVVVELSTKVAEIVQAAKQGCSALAEAKVGQVACALRQSAHEIGESIESLFNRLSDVEDRVSQAAFFRHVDGLAGVSLSEQHKRLFFYGKEAAGLSRKAFLDMVERYYKCVKEIAITSTFDIKKGSTLRKLEVGELVEVLEGPRSDTALGVMRYRARALADGRTGWLTATGNHGTLFLQEVARPCLVVMAAMPLQEQLDGESNEIRTLLANEVLELLEGPRQEHASPTMRIRCKALLDGAVGWFTSKSKHGVDCVQPGQSTYTCVSSIALTDAIDMKNCKVLRKLSKGERLTLLEGPVMEDKSSVPRIRAVASLDGAEGWVTVRGNAGSVYVEESGRQMVVCRAAPLETELSISAGEAIRALALEEVLEVLAGPEEEGTAVPVRAKVRAACDRKVGWVTVQDGGLSPWSSKYRCVTATPIHDGLEVERATVIRRLEVGEEVELLEGPKLEASGDLVRLYGQATKDGAIGWVTIAGQQSKPCLKCLPPE